MPLFFTEVSAGMPLARPAPRSPGGEREAVRITPCAARMFLRDPTGKHLSIQGGVRPPPTPSGPVAQPGN